MANEKISLRDLAELLAQRAGINAIEAETFIRSFADTMIEGLRRDSLVKVKGLGTFKLITVDSRESINVGTGERFLIEAHTKVTFTPDPVLRDEINKPFADLPTVVLGDGMDVSKIGVAKAQDSSDAIEEQTLEVETEELAEAVAAPVQQDTVADAPEEVAAMEIPAPIEEVVEETAPVVEPEPQPVPESDVDETPVPPVTVIEPVEPERLPVAVKWWVWLVLGLLAVALCVLSYVAGYNRWFSTERDSSAYQPEQTETVLPVPEVPVDSTETDEVIDVEEEVMPEEQYPQVADGDYRIVGIRQVHVLKSGESLRQLAVIYYKSKDFVPYIICVNDIKNPDIIPLGMELKIPELEKR